MENNVERHIVLLILLVEADDNKDTRTAVLIEKYPNTRKETFF